MGVAAGLLEPGVLVRGVVETRSAMIRMPRAWAAAVSASKSSTVPMVGWILRKSAMS